MTSGDRASHPILTRAASGIAPIDRNVRWLSHITLEANMSIEPTNNGEQHEPPPSDSWREVGTQLQELVSRISASFRTAWSEERSATPDQPENEATARRLEDDLRESADRLERDYWRVASEPERERSATLKTTRAASSRSMGDARDIAARGLRSLNEQLDQLAKNLEREQADRDKKDDNQPPSTPA
jgi:hypothetical protein